MFANKLGKSKSGVRLVPCLQNERDFIQYYTVYQAFCCIFRSLKSVNARPEVNIRPDVSTKSCIVMERFLIIEKFRIALYNCKVLLNTLIIENFSLIESFRRPKKCQHKAWWGYSSTKGLST